MARKKASSVTMCDAPSSARNTETWSAISRKATVSGGTPNRRPARAHDTQQPANHLPVRPRPRAPPDHNRHRAHRRPDQRSQLKLAAVTGDEAFRPARILRQSDSQTASPYINIEIYNLFWLYHLLSSPAQGHGATAHEEQLAHGVALATTHLERHHVALA
jgi:hypothetical protein